ncbi:MAG: hypothetical protein M3417_03770 [Actinomycetota bacterium]|nr:hypothetical protein [Actinomycetota bacterium]
MVSERSIPLEARSEWERALEAVPHMFGHTWGSAHAHSLTTGYRSFLYEAREDGARAVCPLVERPADGRRDVATPYGFSGLAGTGPWPSPGNLLTGLARRRRYVCGYITVNPLFGDESHAAPNELSFVNHTYTLDLTQDRETLYHNLSKNRKRQLRAWRPGLHESHREPLTAFFLHEYPRFMEGKNAAAYYRFSGETLAAICGLPNVFLLGARAAGRLEAVSVFGYTRHAGDFLFNASLPGGKRHSASLLWSAVQRLIELSVPVLNLGGGLSPGDSLAGFKQRFGARSRPMYVVKKIYDPVAFEALCRRAGRDPEVLDGFFPPYRDR